MGLRFQKSFNLGAGFKISLSKSGIGYSWGVPGFRKTKLSNGRIRTTFNIPGAGFSYVNEKSGKKKKNAEENIVSKTKDISSNIDNMPTNQDISNSDIEFYLSQKRKIKMYVLLSFVAISLIVLFFTNSLFSQIVISATIGTVLLWRILPKKIVLFPILFVIPSICCSFVAGDNFSGNKGEIGEIVIMSSLFLCFITYLTEKLLQKRYGGKSRDIEKILQQKQTKKNENTEIEFSDNINIQLKESTENEFINQLTDANKKISNISGFYIGLYLLTIIIAGFISYFGCEVHGIDFFKGIIALIFVLGIALGYVLSLVEKKYAISVNYNLDDEYKNFYEDIIRALKQLNSCDAIWTDDRVISLKCESPSFIKSNIDIYAIKLGTIDVYILPNRILRVAGNEISSHTYNSFDYFVKHIDVVEENQKFKDALFIREKWRYERKDGKKDERYTRKNFRKFVYRYAKIIVNNSFVFYCSSIDKVRDFQNQLYYIKQRYNVYNLQKGYTDEETQNQQQKNRNIDIFEMMKKASKGVFNESPINQAPNKKDNKDLKNEIDFYLFYDNAVRYMKIKQYSDFKAELFEFGKDGKFTQIKNKTMPILNDFINQNISQKPANTRHAVDLFIKFIKTAKGKEALEKWNHTQANN